MECCDFNMCGFGLYKRKQMNLFCVQLPLYPHTVCVCLYVFPPQGYAAALDNTELTHLIPPALETKKDVLFGNLAEIYDFHNKYVNCYTVYK